MYLIKRLEFPDNLDEILFILSMCIVDWVLYSSYIKSTKENNEVKVKISGKEIIIQVRFVLLYFFSLLLYSFGCYLNLLRHTHGIHTKWDTQDPRSILDQYNTY